MKMGITRNKVSSPPSTPSPSMISRVFPVSWFSKLKQKLEKPEAVSKKNESKSDRLDCVFPNPRPRFHSMDEDDPFRGDEKCNFPARRSTGGVASNPTFYESDHKFGNFDDMVLDMKRMKGRAKESERDVDVFRVEPDHMVRMKFEEIKIKATKKGKVNNKNRKAYSPRTECKIRALEEMKRARMKMERVKEEGVFNSFVVVRNSFDPQRDFRDSMVEMIMEEGIRRPEDLELLLACYLDLNSHEFHDIIIKVFKHVWFELRGR